MAVLRIKDGQGNWVEIPAIVGSKGELGELHSGEISAQAFTFPGVKVKFYHVVIDGTWGRYTYVVDGKSVDAAFTLHGGAGGLLTVIASDAGVAFSISGVSQQEAKLCHICGYC